MLAAINKPHHITGKHKGVRSTPPCGQARGVFKVKTQIIHFFLRKISPIMYGLAWTKAKQAIKPAINEAHPVAGKHKGVGSRKISPIMYGLAYFLSLLR